MKFIPRRVRNIDNKNRRNNRCPRCNCRLDWLYQKYCQACGQRLKW